MNLIFRKKRLNLLAQIYNLKEERERFKRLLAERGNGQRVAMRTKNAKADLKASYGFRYFRSVCISGIVYVLAFVTIPAPNPSQDMATKTQAVVIETVDIPETRQEIRRSALKRPEVPLSVEGEIVPEDVTIEVTELDLDRLEIEVPTLSVPVQPDFEEALEPVEIWAVEEKPQLVRQIQPEYPIVARKAGVEGTVYLKVLVSKAGQVTKAEVVRGKEIFHQAALDAIQEFEFKPARQSDKPVDVWLMVPMQFRLTG